MSDSFSELFVDGKTFTVKDAAAQTSLVALKTQINQKANTSDLTTAVNSLNTAINNLSNEIPTKISELDNDEGFITSASNFPAAKVTGLATIATTGKYSDLIDEPTIPTAASSVIAAVGFEATVGSSTKYAREDHVHNIDVAAGTNPGEITIAGKTVTIVTGGGGGGTITSVNNYAGPTVVLDAKDITMDKTAESPVSIASAIPTKYAGSDSAGGAANQVKINDTTQNIDYNILLNKSNDSKIYGSSNLIFSDGKNSSKESVLEINLTPNSNYDQCSQIVLVNSPQGSTTKYISTITPKYANSKNRTYALPEESGTLALMTGDSLILRKDNGLTGKIYVGGLGDNQSYQLPNSSGTFLLAETQGITQGIAANTTNNKSITSIEIGTNALEVMNDATNVYKENETIVTCYLNELTRKLYRNSTMTDEIDPQQISDPDTKLFYSPTKYKDINGTHTVDSYCRYNSSGFYRITTYPGITIYTQGYGNLDTNLFAIKLPLEKTDTQVKQNGVSLEIVKNNSNYTVENQGGRNYKIIIPKNTRFDLTNVGGPNIVNNSTNNPEKTPIVLELSDGNISFRRGSALTDVVVWTVISNTATIKTLTAFGDYSVNQVLLQPITAKNLKTELNKKLDKSGWTADDQKSKVLVTNSSGNINVSAITTNELSYLGGATSNIQTQLSSAQTQLSNIQTQLDNTLFSTYVSINNDTTKYTLKNDDKNKYILFGGTADKELTIPSNSTGNFSSGAEFKLLVRHSNTNASNKVTILKDSGVTINTALSFSSSIDLKPYQCVTLKHIVSDEWILF